jgi:hypothetical protein
MSTTSWPHPKSDLAKLTHVQNVGKALLVFGHDSLPVLILVGRTAPIDLALEDSVRFLHVLYKQTNQLDDRLWWWKRVGNLAQEIDVLVFEHLGGHPVPLLLEALHVFLRD